MSALSMDNIDFTDRIIDYVRMVILAIGMKDLCYYTVLSNTNHSAKTDQASPLSSFEHHNRYLISAIYAMVLCLFISGAKILRRLLLKDNDNLFNLNHPDDEDVDLEDIEDNERFILTMMPQFFLG